MKYYILTVVFCLAFLPQSLFSQKLSLENEVECGTVLTQGQIDYMNKTRKVRALVHTQLNKINATVTIPLQMHVIRRSNGTGGLSAANVATAVADLNNHFDQLDVIFEMCTINYIDSDALHNNNIPYSNTSGSVEYNMAGANSVADKVNVFCVPNSSTSWSSFPAYGALFGKDWTILKNSHALNTSTLAHELGHYFNLYHTHQGTSTNLNITAKELVNGSNCGPNVGDELCDTPADPSLSGCVSAACAYTCNSTDANGATYAPNPTNLMSYSLKTCRTVFSQQQRTRMLTSLIVDRTNLATSCDGCPVNLTLAGVIPNGETRVYKATNNITTTQTAYYGSTVLYDAGNSITFRPGYRAASGSDVTAKIDGCSSSARMADNYGIEVPKMSESLIEEIQYAEANNRRVPILDTPTLASYPNPFDQHTNITFELTTSSEARLAIYNVTGQQVKELVNGFTLSGNHQVSFDASQVPSGMYYAILETNGTKQSTKLIVQH